MTSRELDISKKCHDILTFNRNPEFESFGSFSRAFSSIVRLFHRNLTTKVAHGGRMPNHKRQTIGTCIHRLNQQHSYLCEIHDCVAFDQPAPVVCYNARKAPQQTSSNLLYPAAIYSYVCLFLYSHTHVCQSFHPFQASSNTTIFPHHVCSQQQ